MLRILANSYISEFVWGQIDPEMLIMDMAMGPRRQLNFWPKKVASVVYCELLVIAGHFLYTKIIGRLDRVVAPYIDGNS